MKNSKSLLSHEFYSMKPIVKLEKLSSMIIDIYSYFSFQFRPSVAFIGFSSETLRKL